MESYGREGVGGVRRGSSSLLFFCAVPIMLSANKCYILLLKNPANFYGTAISIVILGNGGGLSIVNTQ